MRVLLGLLDDLLVNVQPQKSTKERICMVAIISKRVGVPVHWLQDRDCTDR
jgi:hypothetical protein